MTFKIKVYKKNKGPLGDKKVIKMNKFKYSSSSEHAFPKDFKNIGISEETDSNFYVFDNLSRLTIIEDTVNFQVKFGPTILEIYHRIGERNYYIYKVNNKLYDPHRTNIYILQN